MTRDQALEILHEFASTDRLIKHALAVEAAMRAYARKYGEDEDYWGVVGLLHDFDWEIHPTVPDHPLKGAEILRQRGVDEKLVCDILSHADGTGVPRDTLLRKTLFAVDELTGLIIATALVRPSRSLADLKAKSVINKLKDKSFAAGVSREDIRAGAEELGVDLSEHIQFVIDALKPIGPELGLNPQA
ncbi:MAG: HDIG domain-containing protein [Armatimonadetes bacterium]|nr:HDIG domain-containing protein [Armatimonadota bacterium]